MTRTVCYLLRPSGTSGARRVLRGGSYWNTARRCRSAYRNENDPGNRNRNIGFRLAAARPPQVATADPVPDALDFGRAGVVPGRVLVGGQKSFRTLPPGSVPRRINGHRDRRSER